MEDFEHRFEHYLQGHIHPDVQPLARRLTHPTLGRISMQSFLEVADLFQANHEAFDHDLDQGQAVVGWTPDGEFVDNHTPILGRTFVAQQDFDRRVQ